MLKTRVEQLLQILHGAVWDGNLISKKERDMLVTLGLVAKSHGYNIITPKGIECLYNLDLLDPRVPTTDAPEMTVADSGSVSEHSTNKSSGARYWVCDCMCINGAINTQCSDCGMPRPTYPTKPE